MSENSDKEKMSISELQKKGRRKIKKKNSEKKVMEIDGFLGGFQLLHLIITELKSHMTC